MSKVKEYYANEAEKQVDEILSDFRENKFDEKTTKEKILEVDNINLIDLSAENVDEFLYYTKQ